MAKIGGGATGAVSGAASGAMAGAALGPIGIGVGAVLGGLFGSSGTDVPPPPSYQEIMTTNLNSQQAIQGQLLDLESQYRPQYQNLQEQTLHRQLFGGDGTSGYINQVGEANRALLGLQNDYAGQYMNTLSGLTGQARNLIQSPQMASMQNALMAQAQEGLNAGSGLNRQENRMAMQAANQAMAARGLSGRQGVAAGVLSNYAMGQDRLTRNRQFASSMLNAESALHSAALQAAGGAMGGYNAGGAFMQQGNAMLGQYKPQIFTPESQVGTQAQGLKYQQDMAIAQAQEQSKMQMMSSLGSLGSFAAGGGFGGGGLSNPFSNFGAKDGMFGSFGNKMSQMFYGENYFNSDNYGNFGGDMSD